MFGGAWVCACGWLALRAVLPFSLPFVDGGSHSFFSLKKMKQNPPCFLLWELWFFLVPRVSSLEVLVFCFSPYIFCMFVLLVFFLVLSVRSRCSKSKGPRLLGRPRPHRRQADGPGSSVAGVDVHLGRRRRVFGVRAEALRRGGTAAGTVCMPSMRVEKKSWRLYGDRKVLLRSHRCCYVNRPQEK